MPDCTYCGSNLSPYDTVSVTRGETAVGQFCNFACLRTHIEDESLETGDCCHWEP